MKFNTFPKKIFLAYAGVAAILVFSGALSIWQGRELSRVSADIGFIRGPTINAAVTILSGINETQSALKSWLLFRQEVYRENRLETWRNDLTPSIQKLVELAQKWKVKDDALAFERVLSDLDEIHRLQEVIEALPAARNREAVDILDRKLAPLSRQVRGTLDGMVERRNQWMAQDLATQATMLDNLTVLQVALILIGLLVCAIMGTLLGRAIAAPVARTIEAADRIAAGDYGTAVTISGTEEINRLGTALERMRGVLFSKTWLSEAQLRLNDVIRAADGVREVSEKAISSIAGAMEAQSGALYVVDGTKLRVTGGFAHAEGRGPGFVAGLGEGVAGQAAAEKSIMKVSRRAGTPPLLTAAGDVEIGEIAAIPLTYKDEVVGVVELAAREKFPAHRDEFLHIASDVVAIALSGAQRGEQVKNLLQETQAQAEELQAQQEELRQANDELQTRQEELESTNEELEEQREALDQRNLELESAQNAIAERASELDRVSRYKSEFLANMSHELRTPLNSQLILAKMLGENKDGNLTEKQLEFVNTIHSTGLDLLQLINDILDLSKVEAGKLSLELADVPIATLARDWERDFRHAIEGKKLKFVVEVEAGLPPAIRTDALRLGQVVRNLLSNATKFTSEGSITLKFAKPQPSDLPSGLSDPSRAVAIRVIDTGIGIPEDKRQAVFQAFEQVDSSISRKYGGTGLGLAISSNLVALLGGRITLESALGKGSAFTVTVPERHEVADAPETRNDRAPAEVRHVRRSIPEIPAAARQENIMLIIEDDARFAKILGEMAEAKGFRSQIAADGADGLEQALSKVPECILLDYDLPGINGLDVLKELKANPRTRHIPIHMISVEDHSREARLSGAVGYLVKPADPARLHEIMERLKKMSAKEIRRVLVVDDDPLQRQSIIELIGNGRVKSTGVETAEEAYRLLQSETFDCMVLDLKLPDMNGFELLDKLHAGAAAVPPVVVYTAQDLSRDEEQRLRKYSDSIIIKGARAGDRLLDEVSLFIHRVVKELPQDKQKMLADLYNPEKTLQGKRVLLVDDDVRNVFSLSNALEAKGMKISIARNGQEALDALDRDPSLQLVLMDVMMPVMDGYEAMRRIRKSGAYGSVPVIALTAKAMKEDREMCLAAGASDYLPKPVDLDRLMTLLRVWLAK